jgi:hypothetical protein
MFGDIYDKVKSEPEVICSLKGCMSKQNDVIYSQSFIYKRMYEQVVFVEHHG